MAKIVYYAGLVQGVGFRATAVSIARRYPVRGWVRNLPDGRVELLAEGSEDSIAKFLADVHERMVEYISSEDVLDCESDDSLQGFRIVG